MANATARHVGPRQIRDLVRETVSAWSEDKASQLGAALAYYSVFSLGPLLIVVIAVAGLAFGEEAVRGQLLGQLRGLLGQTGAAAVEAMLAGARSKATGVIATIVGLVTLFIGATGVVVNLKDALNTIWGVKPKPGAGVREFLGKYVISFGAIVGLGFLLTVSLVLNAVLGAVSHGLGALLPFPELVLSVLNAVVSFAGVTMLFALVFKVLPDVEIAWRDVWLGALVTALLFSVGKLLIGLYLRHKSMDSTYGAAGSIVIVLLWIYYSAQILFFGCEFKRMYAKDFGSGYRPSETGEPVTRDERAVQGRAPRSDPATAPPARSEGEGAGAEIGGPRPRRV